MCLSYSYCSWAPFFCFLARFEGVEIFILTSILQIFFFHAAIWPTFLVNWFQDHMRKAGDVCFAEVSRDSEGMHLCKICPLTVWYYN
jgi:hypothetical protein